MEDVGWICFFLSIRLSCFRLLEYLVMVIKVMLWSCRVIFMIFFIYVFFVFRFFVVFLEGDSGFGYELLWLLSLFLVGLVKVGKMMLCGIV